MWTERERIIDNFEDAITYIKQQDYFHDYRMGNIEIDNNSVLITIEEDTGNIANKNAHVWDFKFNNISNFKCEMTVYSLFSYLKYLSKTMKSPSR